VCVLHVLFAGLQVARMLNDPDTLRQMSQVMSNPVSGARLGTALCQHGHWAPNVPERTARSVGPLVRRVLVIPHANLQTSTPLLAGRGDNPRRHHSRTPPLVPAQALMREQVRNMDRAMSNIESMPGGFNALRQFHSQLQASCGGQS
jgi:hypothetical protein